MERIIKSELDAIGISVVDYIVSMLRGKFNNNQALCLSMNKNHTNGKGYLVGVVTYNERGYIPTEYIIDEPDYSTASKWVDAANVKLFSRPARESAIIVLSSMSRGDALLSVFHLN